MQLQTGKTQASKITGDIREYVIFRSDLEHIVDTQYTKREAITLQSLQGTSLYFRLGSQVLREGNRNRQHQRRCHTRADKADG